ncbi:MAG: hypothetical protein ACI4P4_15975 [Faecousia sp.]
MSYQPQMFYMPNVAFDHAALEKKYPLWEAQAKTWKRLDRIYSNEAQIVSLAEVLETTKYLSSDTLLHPSIPEFVVISEEPQLGANTYMCFRKSLLAEEDILPDNFGQLTRRMIPVVDAYVYLNNNGTLCNYVVTLCKCILEVDGRRNTSTGQFITYIHDDPVSHSYANYDPQFIFEFNRTIKMLYLIVQMVSLERPEIICYGRTAIQEPSSNSKKKTGQKRPVHMVKTIRFPTNTASMLAESMKREPVKITCPCWGVAGHWRTYKKSGKKVWIEPYRKGKQRHNPTAYQSKNYQFPEIIKEV